MRLCKYVLPLAVLATSLSSPAVAGDRGWARASSIGRDALVVSALGIPAITGDWNGALQGAGSMGAAGVLTYGLKKTFPELRPDGSDRRSFPSGHTSVSFAAAGSLHQRYGWKVGLPATVVATFVGLARVEADKHHWYDVVVGAAIGEASGFLLTSKRDGDVRLIPWGDTHGAGLVMTGRF
ncbi:MAG: hypothetical protein JWN59_1350 [Sphingomonas bacterium]|nr:hypothetical protein [Sphingomonas bacterium]